MVEDVGFGIDYGILEGSEQDLDDAFAERNDIEIIGMDCYKACYASSEPVISVDDGELLPIVFWEDPPVSWDLREFLNDTIEQAQELEVQRLIANTYDGDRRIDSIRVATRVNDGTLEVSVVIVASGALLSMGLVADSNAIRVTEF